MLQAAIPLVLALSRCPRVMRSVKSLTLALIILLGSCPLVSNADPDWQRRRPSPKYLLLKSMTSARRFAYTAVIIHRTAYAFDAEVEMKMEQDTLGRTRFTVWQPSMHRGMITYDDGVNWYTFHPGHRSVLKQESPRIVQGNPAYQVYLADENYTWKMEASTEIAGCPTTMITATPKAKGLNIRRYYLDSRTSLMLKMETVSPEGKKFVQLETRSLAYLKESPKLTIPGEGDDSIRTRNMPQPERVWPTSTAKDKVGFTPIIPDRIPYGFIVKTVEIADPPHNHLVAIRFTDGLVTGTIYQWKDSNSKYMGPLGSKQGTVVKDGIRMRIFGDIPMDLAKKTLQSFVTK